MADHHTVQFGDQRQGERPTAAQAVDNQVFAVAAVGIVDVGVARDGGNGVDVAGLFGPDAQVHVFLPPGWLLAPL